MNTQPNIVLSEQEIRAAEKAVADAAKPGVGELVAATAAGAAAGALAGAIAGPPGAVVGAIIGATAGAGVELVEADREAEVRAHNEKLDEEIGVSGGDIGAASPFAPKPRRAAISAASAGISTPEGDPAAGPIPRGDA